MEYKKVDTKLLLRAIEIYGEEAQIDMMIEEMSELTQALLKYRRYLNGHAQESFDMGWFYVENVIGEMADVFIMLQQMIFIYGDITKVYDEKIKRLKARIDGR